MVGRGRIDPRNTERRSRPRRDHRNLLRLPRPAHSSESTGDPPFASVPDDLCWSVMLDETFRENQLIVIEPNPVTPGLQRGFFIGGMNVVTKDGAVSLHDVPLELTCV